MKKKHMKIFESYEIPSENIKNSEINLSHPISFAELREILIQISTILEERTEENVYVVSLSSGKSNSKCKRPQGQSSTPLSSTGRTK